MKKLQQGGGPTHRLAGGSKTDRHPIYTAWAGLKQRCYNSKAQGYSHYGARGIKVCDRWLESFENFRDDMLPTWQQGLELDRTDNNGDYTLENCKWVTSSANAKNRRTKSIDQSLCSFIFKQKKTKNHSERWVFKKLFVSKEEAESFYLKIKDFL
jgi:hypothetical protein